jgi:hypothetical protein
MAGGLLLKTIGIGETYASTFWAGTGVFPACQHIMSF